MIDYLRWLYFCSRVILRGFHCRRKFCKSLSIYSSSNQLRSIRSLDLKFEELRVFSNYEDATFLLASWFILLMLLIVSFPYFLLVSIFYLSNKLRTKAYLISVSTIYIFMYLSFLLWASFKKNAVSKILVSNDHLFFFRALVCACKGKILCSYIQHACIGRSFPPLDVFDKAFLDGPYSLSQYPPNVGDCSVEFLGDRRIENCQNIKNERLGDRITFGVGISDINHLIFLQGFMEHLTRESLEVKIIIRCHRFVRPNSFKKIESLMANFHYDFEIQSSRDKNICDFFSAITCLIAGTSSIHLDAIVNGIPSFYFELDDYGDAYGFKAHDLIPSFNISTILNDVSSYDIADIKSKYYGHSV